MIVKIDKKIVWKNYFGEKESGTDIFGRKITKKDFVVDFIYPVARGGEAVYSNAIPLHIDSKKERKHDLHIGKVNDLRYDMFGTRDVGVVILEGSKRFDVSREVFEWGPKGRRANFFGPVTSNYPNPRKAYTKKMGEIEWFRFPEWKHDAWEK